MWRLLRLPSRLLRRLHHHQWGPCAPQDSGPLMSTCAVCGKRSPC